MAYFWFGFALVVLYGAIVLYYYARKRHGRVEAPKYKMMDDEE